MRLTESTEELTREVSMPDRTHEGVKFSSPTHGSSTVTLNFTRWVDMGYPNKVIVTVIPQPTRAGAAARLAATG